MANTRISSETGIDKVKDGTITQASLAPNVAGNGPVFSALLTTPQTIANGVDTVVLFNDDSTSPNMVDTASCYNPATGRFKPTVPGYYQLNVTVPAAASGMSAASSSFRKNGVAYCPVGTLFAAFTGLPFVISGPTLMHLNGTTDYADVTAYITGSGGGNNIASGARFSGFLARAA